MAVPYKLDQHVNPYHGYDGFGDCDLPPEDPKIEKEHAVLALIRLAQEYAGKNLYPKESLLLVSVCHSKGRICRTTEHFSYWSPH